MRFLQARATYYIRGTPSWLGGTAIYRPHGSSKIKARALWSRDGNLASCLLSVPHPLGSRHVSRRNQTLKLVDAWICLVVCCRSRKAWPGRLPMPVKAGLGEIGVLCFVYTFLFVLDPGATARYDIHARLGTWTELCARSKRPAGVVNITATL